jgi:hypothetical protein
MLEALDLAAHRGHARLFEGLSFAVRRAKALIVTSARGGKTTLLRMLTGCPFPPPAVKSAGTKPVAPFDSGLRVHGIRGSRAG